MSTGNARFDTFIELLLEFETEFNPDGTVRVERDPDDPGGTTKYGIDQRSHPRVNIAALTRDGALHIYFADWTRLPCDELPRPLGELLMDIVQNGGPGARWIQEALGVVVDGFIGPKTLAAAAVAARGEGGVLLRRIVHHVCDRREDRFRAIVKARPRMKKYLRGWLRRNEAMRTWALAHLSQPTA